ncbi:HU family DNA-binding protein [Leisingera thetidis]|uniref:HU family DNA-binding protein n=1 Tax=Leisingera thetidis TaxID=2930199 RepID=UPI0021F72777|nr:HU family DNA-binding protein [Leisingera thetidis]
MARATSKGGASARNTSTRKTSSRKPGTLTASAGKSAAASAAAGPDAAPPPVTGTAAGKLPQAAPAAGGSAAPEPVVVAAAAPVVAAPELGKKELVEQAVERSGIKKKDAKPVVEAVLGLLGEAIAEGRELNLKPFGKLKINRSQERSNGKVFVCKLRRPEAAKGAASEIAEEDRNSSKDPLAEAASDG